MTVILYLKEVCFTQLCMTNTADANKEQFDRCTVSFMNTMYNEDGFRRLIPQYMTNEVYVAAVI